jgi:hypothetical protein
VKRVRLLREQLIVIRLLNESESPSRPAPLPGGRVGPNTVGPGSLKRRRQNQALALRFGAQGATSTAYAAVGRPGESKADRVTLGACSVRHKSSGSCRRLGIRRLRAAQVAPRRIFRTWGVCP